MVDEEYGETGDMEKMMFPLEISNELFTQCPDLITLSSDLFLCPLIAIVSSCRRSCNDLFMKVEPSNIQETAFLNAVVKVYCTHTAPDYSLPWQKQRQYTSNGSAFMIERRKLLTNAHCVKHDTQVKIKRSGDDTKYVTKNHYSNFVFNLP